jgi:hypothetical protein
MKAITLRNIPSEIQRAILTRAKQKRISANLLRERVGILEAARKTTYSDLDDLAGSWSAQETKAFDRTVGFSRRIDEELWP